MDFGFTVLCPERNSSGLRNTVNICRSYNKSVQCIVGSDAKLNEIQELSRHCKVIQGGNTITSLIDCGIKNSCTPWTMIIMAGSCVRRAMLKKYLYFQKEQREVLYPVVDRKIYFDDASINGIFINKIAIEEVGNFDNGTNDLRFAKLVWADNAIKLGYKFKALVGVRFI